MRYSGPGAGGVGDCEAPPGSATATFCLMDNYFTRGANMAVPDTGPYSLNELCVNSNHDPDKDTYQESRQGKSCWATIAAYSALTGSLKTRGGTAPAALPVAAAPAATAPTYFESGAGRRFVLIIDRSGSMGTVDGASGSPTRMALAKQAASIFVDLVKVNEEIGVVSFSDSTAVSMALTKVTTASKTAAKSAINGLSAGGSTAIGDALVAGRNVITSGTKICCQTIVLFTDGENNSGVSETSVIPSLVAANITVISVAIGTGVSTANLSQIAGDTAGKFFQVANSANLPALMAALSAEATGGGLMARQPGFVSSGQTVERSVLVDPATQELTVTLTTDLANTIDLSLVSPAGTVYSATAAPNVEFLSSAGTRIGIIRRPTLTVGTWKIRVAGRTVTNNAYDVTVSGVAPGVALTGTSDKAQYTYPNAATITATPHFGQAVIGASVRATVVTPLGTKLPIDLFDDGLASHGDGVANDGEYSARFSNYAAGPGTYQFDIVADSTADVEGVSGRKPLRHRGRASEFRRRPAVPPPDQPLDRGHGGQRERFRRRWPPRCLGEQAGPRRRVAVRQQRVDWRPRWRRCHQHQRAARRHRSDDLERVEPVRRRHWLLHRTPRGRQSTHRYGDLLGDVLARIRCADRPELHAGRRAPDDDRRQLRSRGCRMSPCRPCSTRRRAGSSSSAR